jgi:putative ABC transport system permease protein
MAGVNLSGIFYIYEARLEARAVLVQEGFAILGIAIGVALLFASQISSASLTHSIAQLNSQLVGNAQVQLEARGPEGVNERLLDEIRHVPGVQAALPIFDQQLTVIGPHGERSVDLIGVNPSSVRISGPLLRRFSAKQLAAQHAIALPTPLASAIGVGPLEVVKLQVGARFVETLVAATLDEANIGSLVHSPIAIAPISFAQQLTGAHGQLSRIFVRYNPASAKATDMALARIAARWDVNLLPAKFDSRLFAVAVSPESQSETLFSAISALVGFMFALNAMLVTVPSRRALINDIRPQGASRWDTAKILLFDAAVIGVMACVLGLALGDLLSIAVFHTTPNYLAVAFPIGNNRIVTWQSVAVAVTAGMIAAIVGVFWPLREILARPLLPTRAGRSDHRRSRTTTPRLVIGVLCLALTTVTLTVDTKAALVGNIALVASLVILLPLLYDVLVGLFKQLSNVFDDIASVLAITELRSPQTRVRSLAITATAAVAVFGVVEFQGIQTNLKRGLDTSSRDIDSAADVWVIPKGKTNVQATTPFEAVNTAPLTRIAGIARVDVFRGSFFNWGDRRLWVLAPASGIAHPVPVTQVVSGNAELASERVSAGGWAVLSQALAAEHGLHVGQTFTLPSPRPLTLRVAALMTNLGWPPGALILNSATYARAWASNAPTAYTIQTASGVPAAVVRNRVRRALASVPGLAVETSGERDQRRYAIAAQGLSRLTQIRVLVLIAAILAVIGAMGSMIWQRRDLIAFIKVQGYEEGTLWRWLLCEAAVLLTIGCLIGATFGIYAQLLGSRFLATVTGFPIVFSVEWLAAVSSFVLVSVIALAVVALPGYLVVRVPPNTAAKPTY